MGSWTGTVPTITGGTEAAASDVAILAAIATAQTAASSTWTPTWTNLTVGSGSVEYHYRQVGKWVDIYLRFRYGAGSAVGTSPQFTLPAALASYYGTTDDALPLHCEIRDAATTSRVGRLTRGSTTSIAVISYWNSTPAPASITSTAPWTWTTNDEIAVWGTYEAA